MTIAGGTGISGGSAFLVPRLLMRRRGSCPSPLSAASPTAPLAGEEAVDDAPLPQTRRHGPLGQPHDHLGQPHDHLDRQGDLPAAQGLHHLSDPRLDRRADDHLPPPASTPDIPPRAIHLRTSEALTPLARNRLGPRAGLEAMRPPGWPIDTPPPPEEGSTPTPTPDRGMSPRLTSHEGGLHS